MIKVGICGVSGFLGGEAARLIHQHPNFELTYLAAGETAGKSLSSVRQAFRGLIDLEIQSFEAEEAAKCDVVILALPHGASAQVAEQLLPLGVTVVDLGSDFRIRDRAAAERYYDRAAPRQALLDAAFYSLPELTGPPPSQTKLIASPGCFATAINMMLAPLAKAGLLSEAPTIFGVTGSSGSGISLSTGVHHSLRSTNFLSYKSLRHQHIGEIKQLLSQFGFEGEVNFVPHSAPVVRGIHLTAVFSPPADAIRQAYEESYQDKPTVFINDGPVAMASVVQSNRVAIGVDPADSATTVTLAIDNLLKGGAGQAIQSMNLLYDLPEGTGLPMIGVWP